MDSSAPRRPARFWSARRLPPGRPWPPIRLGNYAQGLDDCRHALVLFQKDGIRYRQAAALDSIGHAFRHLGDHDRALDHYRRALACSRNSASAPRKPRPGCSFTIAAGNRDGGLVVAANVNSDDRDYPIETFSDLLREVCAAKQRQLQ